MYVFTVKIFAWLKNIYAILYLNIKSIDFNILLAYYLEIVYLHKGVNNVIGF